MEYLRELGPVPPELFDEDVDYPEFAKWVTTTLKRWLEDDAVFLTALRKQKQEEKTEKETLLRKEEEVKAQEEALEVTDKQINTQRRKLSQWSEVLEEQKQDLLARKAEIERKIDECDKQHISCDAQIEHELNKFHMAERKTNRLNIRGRELKKEDEELEVREKKTESLTQHFQKHAKEK
jgi:chromosome segregation ATPase